MYINSETFNLLIQDNNFLPDQVCFTHSKNMNWIYKQLVDIDIDNINFLKYNQTSIGNIKHCYKIASDEKIKNKCRLILLKFIKYTKKNSKLPFYMTIYDNKDIKYLL